MNNKSHHVYYTPMSKRAEKEKENKLDDSEFPSLTKSTTSTSIVANANANANAIANYIAKPILNFLEAAKKPPAPEEESMVHSENKSDSENENENDTKNEPVIFKKGLSFD